MIGKILKTEVVADENGTYTVKCILNNFISYID